MPLLLERIDPRRSMARFYLLSIEPTLFGPGALRRNWGRLGTWGRRRPVLHEDEAAARGARACLPARKLKKGYRARPMAPGVARCANPDRTGLLPDRAGEAMQTARFSAPPRHRA